MTSNEPEHAVEDADDQPDDGLLNLARCVWKYRWFMTASLLLGSVLGLAYAASLPARRTTATIRWLSPHLSYLYQSYWDISGRTRAAQLQGLISQRADAAQIALRTQKEHWILKIEVLHDERETGKLVIEQLLSELKRTDEKNSGLPGAVQDRSKLAAKLVQTLSRIEETLSSIQTPNTPSEAETLPDVALSKLNQQFSSEAGPRIPLENLPWFPWYRRVQLKAATVLSSYTPTNQYSAEPIVALPELLDQATIELLQYWTSLDLLVSAGPLPAWTIESVSETELNTHTRFIQYSLLGVWTAAFLSILLVLPWNWVSTHWSIIAEQCPANKKFV